MAAENKGNRRPAARWVAAGVICFLLVMYFLLTVTPVLLVLNLLAHAGVAIPAGVVVQGCLVGPLVAVLCVDVARRWRRNQKRVLPARTPAPFVLTSNAQPVRVVADNQDHRRFDKSWHAEAGDLALLNPATGFLMQNGVDSLGNAFGSNYTSVGEPVSVPDAEVNPATSLPILDGVFDAGGNLYGTNAADDYNSSLSTFDVDTSFDTSFRDSASLSFLDTSGGDPFSS